MIVWSKWVIWVDFGMYLIGWDSYIGFVEVGIYGILCVYIYIIFFVLMVDSWVIVGFYEF